MPAVDPRAAKLIGREEGRPRSKPVVVVSNPQKYVHVCRGKERKYADENPPAVATKQQVQTFGKKKTATAVRFVGQQRPGENALTLDWLSRSLSLALVCVSLRWEGVGRGRSSGPGRTNTGREREGAALAKRQGVAAWWEGHVRCVEGEG